MSRDKFIFLRRSFFSSCPHLMWASSWQMRAAGYKRIVLWTQSTLTAARKLYVGEGYQLKKQEPHHSFGEDLVGETWELDLTKLESAV